MTLPLRAALYGLFAVLAVTAQDAALAGHYEGKIQAGERQVQLSFDFYQTADKAWAGHTTLTPGPREMPLADIRLHAGKLTFTFAGNLPTAPKFEGKFDEAAKTIEGTISGGQGSAPFNVKRTGEAKVLVPVESSKLTKDFEGRWEGTLSPPGQTLRLVVTFSPDAQGNASAVVVSVDQDNARIPVSSTTINGNELSFVVKLVDGSFKGKLNEAKTEVAGEWTQFGNMLPLTLKRAAASPEPDKK